MRYALASMMLATTTLAAELPDPLVFADGHRVQNADDWGARRGEIRKLVMQVEYGELPPTPRKVTVTQLISHQLQPAMTQHEQYKVICDLGEGKDKLGFVIDLLIPPGNGPFPVILRGDWCWKKTPDDIAKTILDRGYIVADFNRLEFSADREKQNVGLVAAYPDGAFGAVAAWAWGFGRAVDALVTLPVVDKNKIAVTGHSRGGKAALLAGALDERIALTAPNGSGCGGAGCFRIMGEKAETLEMITRNFPTWFTPKFREFAGREDELPLDQHFVKALVAPRALLTTEGLDDLHANPSGAYATHRAARAVYELLGKSDRIAVHFRPGGHEHNATDFAAMLDFADECFSGKESSHDWNANPFADSAKPK
jgi:hypothetical protein